MLVYGEPALVAPFLLQKLYFKPYYLQQLMFQIKKLIPLIAIPALFTACQPEESYQVRTIEADVSNVVLPDTVELGDTAKIVMTYKILNDCGEFIGTDVSRNGNSILLRPMVTYTFDENSDCPEEISLNDVTVKFKPDAKGKYLFYFKKENAYNYVADTVVVK